MLCKSVKAGGNGVNVVEIVFFALVSHIRIRMASDTWCMALQLKGRHMLQQAAGMGKVHMCAM